MKIERTKAAAAKITEDAHKALRVWAAEEGITFQSLLESIILNAISERQAKKELKS